MMYDPIFSKSFSRYERKKFGCYALFLCFIISLGISSSFKPHLHRLPSIDAIRLQLSINPAKEFLIIDDTPFTNSNQTAVRCAAEKLKFPGNATANHLVNNNKSTILQSTAVEQKKVKTICRNTNYCEIEGDIRIEANSSTIFIITPLETISNSTNSCNVEPYPRKGTSKVKNWTITYKNDVGNTPKCTQNHSHPSILFSVGGFSGNFFHDFADILFPLYSTSLNFQKEVQFLASDYKSWWINKFKKIMNKLTRYNILDVNRETSQVHCYNKIIIGLKFHKELVVHPSEPSMQNFRRFLRQAYTLERETTIRSRKRDGSRPRLMIISRKRTRIITNEDQVSTLARKLGFEVVFAEAGVSTNLSRFARTVNSCDVLMGVHGAGLTNMVFLPDNAVLIQVVPFGSVDGFARLDFGNPSAGMNIKYLEYKINVKESSLRQKYSTDHPILKDPKSVMGWKELWSIYLNQQNVTIDLHRFTRSLTKAYKLLNNSS